MARRPVNVWTLLLNPACAAYGPVCLQSIELLYLRAICHHAMGYIRKAAADYELCMAVPRRPDDHGPLAEEAA